MAWDMMMQLMPTIGKNMPPEIMVKMLEYSPLPTSIVMKLQQMTDEIKKQQQPAIQAKQQAEMQTIESEILLNRSSAMKNVAEAQGVGQRSQLQQQKQSSEHVLSQAELAIKIMEMLQQDNQPEQSAAA